MPGNEEDAIRNIKKFDPEIFVSERHADGLVRRNSDIVENGRICKSYEGIL